jgi:metal-sulfur cluster biosynthetic enzyme
MMEPDIVGALEGIVDPELGIGIVDLGLVYRAEYTAAGIEVVLTMTSPTCPASELMVAQVREALRGRFPDSAYDVTLTWTPPWSPSRMSDAARARLGWPGAATRPEDERSWPARLLARMMRH